MLMTAASVAVCQPRGGRIMTRIHVYLVGTRSTIHICIYIFIYILNKILDQIFWYLWPIIVEILFYINLLITVLILFYLFSILLQSVCQIVRLLYQINQYVGYVHICLELAILINMSTNNRSQWFLNLRSN